MRAIPKDLISGVEEKLLAGMCLRHPQAAAAVDPRVFHNTALEAVVRSAQRQWPKGDVDVTVVARDVGEANLRKLGGAPAISMILEYGASPDYEVTLESLQMLYDRRKLWIECQKASNDLKRLIDPLPEIASRLSDATKLGDAPKTESNLDSLVRLTAIAESRAPTGIPIKIKALSHYLKGWMPGRNYVIAGRPGMGKTQLAIDIAVEACKEVPVLFVSLEMDRDELMLRTVANIGGLSQSAVMDGTINIQLFSSACEKAAEIPLRIVDCGVKRISDVERVAYSSEAGLIIVDYLQLLKGKGSNREQEVSSISRSLKMIARELRVPMLSLCQLNRGVEERSNKRPLLADLRESGSIEQDADVVLMLYRDGYYTEDPNDKTLDIIVRKNRHGRGTGTATCIFDFDQCRSYDMDRSEIV